MLMVLSPIHTTCNFVPLFLHCETIPRGSPSPLQVRGVKGGRAPLVNKALHILIIKNSCKNGNKSALALLELPCLSIWLRQLQAQSTQINIQGKLKERF